MPFHPEALSEATLKDLARNLQQGSKTVLKQQPLKLSQAQELLARVFGYPSWHRLITGAKAKPAATGRQLLSELTATINKVSTPDAQAAMLEAFHKEAEEARVKKNQALGAALQARLKPQDVFTVQGIQITHEETCATDGLLPAVLFHLFPDGHDSFRFTWENESALCVVEADFIGDEKEQKALVKTITQALRKGVAPSTVDGKTFLDNWYEELKGALNKRDKAWLFSELAKSPMVA